MVKVNSINKMAFQKGDKLRLTLLRSKTTTHKIVSIVGVHERANFYTVQYGKEAHTGVPLCAGLDLTTMVMFTHTARRNSRWEVEDVEKA